MSDSLYSRWVYIFGMENEGTFLDGLFPSGGPLDDIIAPDLYKIGTTINPMRRWQQVQVHSPWELRVFAIIPGGYDLEAEVHRCLDKYRIRGEWFGMGKSTMYRVLDEFGDHLATGRETFTDLPWADIVYEGESE